MTNANTNFGVYIVNEVINIRYMRDQRMNLYFLNDCHMQ